MKKLLTLLLALSLALPASVLAVTAFNSAQVGSSPLNGYILQTNGSISTWVPPTAGGASGAGTFSTTTSSVAGQLINYPNNTTDIVCIGGTATSTCKFYFDPNLIDSFLTNLRATNSTTTNATTTNASFTKASTTSAWVSGLGTAAGTFVAANALGQLIATTSPYDMGTTTIYVDQNSILPVANGTQMFPYKTISSAIRSYPASYWISPGTYVEGGCNLNFTATSTIEFNQATLLCFSGTPFASGAGQITFSTGAIIKDAVLALGNLSFTDTALVDPVTVKDSYLGGGNISLAGLATIQGGQLTGGEVYTKPGSLTAFQFLLNNDLVGVAGTANFDTMQFDVSAVGAGKYGLVASTTGGLLEINGMTYINTAANGGGIYCAGSGGTVSSPNVISSLTGIVGTTTNSGAVNCGNTAISAGPYGFTSSSNGASLYINATNPQPFDFLGLDTEGTTTLAKFGGSVGAGTSTPQWTLQSSNTTGKPQLTLSDASIFTNNHWSLRNSNGVLYIATSSPSTFATSSVSALTIDGNGQLTAPFYAGTGCAQWGAGGILTNTGSACGSGGSGDPYPFKGAGNSTSTLVQFNAGLTSVASTTIGNGTAAGGLTINGTATTTLILLGDGLATNPSLAFIDDQNNGIFSPANDIFAIATNGVERFRIDDSSAFSGFGTTTPKWLLQLASSTRSQLTLSDPTNTTNPHLSFRYAGGVLTVATSSPSTYATSTTPSLVLDTTQKPYLAVGTTTAFSTNSVETLTAGASATTTLNWGSIGLSTSKVCVNIQTSAGTVGSFYMNGAGSIVSQLGACTP